MPLTPSEARTRRRKARYETLPGEMGNWATRKGKDSDYEKHRTDIVKALSLPRNEDGNLSDASIQIMLKVQKAEADKYMSDSAAAGPTNAPKTKAEAQALKKALKARPYNNKVTGKTDLPELKNLFKLTNIPEAVVTSELKVGSVKLKVIHGTRDVNLKPRLTMFKTAISKIEKAGFRLPESLVIHLPKWGRTIDATTLCDSGSTPRAVFNPPNFVHLSPAVVGNPIDRVLNSGSGDFYQNLSTELDPDGAASVVHELGHMMHFTKEPGKFFGLHGAGFNLAGGNIAAKVSGYASGNPREFVAEVFMGLVHGLNFDDEILAMYADFGGPISDRIEARIAKARAKGPLSHTRKEAKPQS